jgi:hypothetical protein
VNKPLNKLKIVISGEQGHGKTMALQVISNALSALGFQVWARDDGDLPWVYAKGGDEDGPLFLSVANIETKHSDDD